jgi:hypothetical protein
VTQQIFPDCRGQALVVAVRINTSHKGANGKSFVCRNFLQQKPKSILQADARFVPTYDHRALQALRTLGHRFPLPPAAPRSRSSAPNDFAGSETPTHI